MTVQNIIKRCEEETGRGKTLLSINHLELWTERVGGGVDTDDRAQEISFIIFEEVIIEGQTIPLLPIHTHVDISEPRTRFLSPGRTSVR